MKKYACAVWIVASSLGFALCTASATENGESHVDLGYVDTFVALPGTPGIYLRFDEDIVNSGRLNNGFGDRVSLNLGPGKAVPVKFRNTIEESIFAFGLVPDLTVPYVNGRIASGLYGSFINSRTDVTSSLGIPAPHANEKAGVTDITFVPLSLAFTLPRTRLSVTIAPLDFTAPTGRYSVSDPIANNAGKNYFSYRPALLFTYQRASGIELDLNLSASINSQNPDTHYKSGSEFAATWSGQQYVTPQLGLGIGGYYYRQISDDRQFGRVVNTVPALDLLTGLPGNRGETFAIGPVVSFNFNPNAVVETHWDHELFAYNRAKVDQFYVRAVLHF